MEPNSCSKRVKKLIKVWLSEGGGIQFDLLLKGDGFPWMLLQKKYCFNMCVLNLVQDIFIIYIYYYIIIYILFIFKFWWG